MRLDVHHDGFSLTAESHADNVLIESWQGEGIEVDAYELDGAVRLPLPSTRMTVPARMFQVEFVGPSTEDDE